MTTGDLDKPLMLLLHGFPELWTMWKKQMSEFRKEYNVAAIDMRGYGRSGRPTVRAQMQPESSTIFTANWQLQ